MRAPEPDAAGDAGDGSGTVEGLSLFRRVTGGERQLSPRCIADADDLASVVTQGSTDPKPRGARRKRASRRLKFRASCSCMPRVLVPCQP